MTDRFNERYNDEFTTTIDEFMEMIEPELAYQVDQWIESQEPEYRPLLRRKRSMLIHESRQRTRIANLEHRLRCAEARSRPADATLQ